MNPPNRLLDYATPLEPALAARRRATRLRRATETFFSAGVLCLWLSALLVGIAGEGVARAAIGSGSLLLLLAGGTAVAWLIEHDRQRSSRPSRAFDPILLRLAA